MAAQSGQLSHKNRSTVRPLFEEYNRQDAETDLTATNVGDVRARMCELYKHVR